MRFQDIVAGLPETKLVYWEEPYRKEDKANLIRAVKEGGSYYLVLNSTIFYPKSGGQPSDTGTLIGDDFTISVKKCFKVDGHVVLWGKSQGEVKLGEVVQKIDWDNRYLFMRRHAAAHLFDAALEKVRLEACDPVDSWLGNDAYVGYRGKAPDKDELESIIQFMRECIGKNLAVTSRIVDRNEVRENRSLWKSVLENLERIRIVQIDDFNPVPCGGTHVEKLGELKDIIIKEVKQEDETFRVYYDVSK
jgi:Ser-tRNA(Ala) deacylase AlaX